MTKYGPYRPALGPPPTRTLPPPPRRKEGQSKDEHDLELLRYRVKYEGAKSPFPPLPPQGPPGLPVARPFYSMKDPGNCLNILAADDRQSIIDIVVLVIVIAIAVIAILMIFGNG